MPTTIPLLLAVFVFGFALGGFLVALQRNSRIEKLKQEFQAQLEALVEKNGADLTASTRTASSEPEKAPAGPSRAA